jgi:hypothetical protein
MARPFEDVVTTELVEALRAVDNDARVAFVSRVLGVPISPRGGEVRISGHGDELPLRAGGKTALIGLGLTTDVAWPSAGASSPGGLVDVVLLQAADLTVLIEAKVRGSLDGWQLARHARAWDLPVPAPPWEELPAGVAATTWATVAAWLESLADPPPPAQKLATRIAERDLAVGEALLDPPRVRRQPATDEPISAPVEDLLAKVDLAGVLADVRSLYAPGGPGFVRSPGEAGKAPTTIQDSRRVILAFEALGELGPHGLGDEGDSGVGDVLTPRRTLSLFCDRSRRATRTKAFLRGGAARWPEVRDRLLTRGADRGVAVALWALATELDGADRGVLQEHVRRLWWILPPSTPATEELTPLLLARGVPLYD